MAVVGIVNVDNLFMETSKVLTIDVGEILGVFLECNIDCAHN